MRRFKEVLRKAERTESKLRKRLFILGYLTKTMEERGLKPPIMVGGSAVMFYTLEHYVTYDVDLVCEDREQLEALLEECGFKRIGRHWILPEVDLAIEIPSIALEGMSYDRVRRVRLDSYEVRIVGMEDLIIDRLRAYKHWSSEADRDQAMMIIAGNYQDIDWLYLTRRARKGGLGYQLREVKRRSEEALRMLSP
jgi:predicted nucleotidyltransferase